MKITILPTQLETVQHQSGHFCCCHRLRERCLVGVDILRVPRWGERLVLLLHLLQLQHLVLLSDVLAIMMMRIRPPRPRVETVLTESALVDAVLYFLTLGTTQVAFLSIIAFFHRAKRVASYPLARKMILGYRAWIPARLACTSLERILRIPRPLPVFVCNVADNGKSNPWCWEYQNYLVYE
jgi:hypothetical protein